MLIAGKQIRPTVEVVANEALNRGYDLPSMIAHPTLNQRCPRCHEHFGFVCVCTREQLRSFANKGANMQTPSAALPVSGSANILQTANKPNVCKCGAPARPRGLDCWKCYRREAWRKKARAMVGTNDHRD